MVLRAPTDIVRFIACGSGRQVMEHGGRLTGRRYEARGRNRPHCPPTKASHPVWLIGLHAEGARHSGHCLGLRPRANGRWKSLPQFSQVSVSVAGCQVWRVVVRVSGLSLADGP